MILRIQSDLVIVPVTTNKTFTIENSINRAILLINDRAEAYYVIGKYFKSKEKPKEVREKRKVRKTRWSSQ